MIGKILKCCLFYKNSFPLLLFPNFLFGGFFPFFPLPPFSLPFLSVSSFFPLFYFYFYFLSFSSFFSHTVPNHPTSRHRWGMVSRGGADEAAEGSAGSLVGHAKSGA
jgi:hypothetical protein